MSTYTVQHIHTSSAESKTKLQSQCSSLSLKHISSIERTPLSQRHTSYTLHCFYIRFHTGFPRPYQLVASMPSTWCCWPFIVVTSPPLTLTPQAVTRPTTSGCSLWRWGSLNAVTLKNTLNTFLVFVSFAVSLLTPWHSANTFCVNVLTERRRGYLQHREDQGKPSHEDRLQVCKQVSALCWLQKLENELLVRYQWSGFVAVCLTG